MPPHLPVATRSALAWLALAGLAAARVAYLWLTPYDLVPDEAYYWDWSRHLDIAFRTKGPLVAWVIAAAAALGGSTAPVVRLPAALASVATVGAAGLLAARLYGRAAGWLAAAMVAVAPIFAAQGLVVTVDPFLAAAWAVAALALYEATHGRPAAWWAVGLALAFGVLAKYTALFLVPGIWLYAATRPAGARRGAALATGIGTLGLVPPLLWNVRHGWATVAHLAHLASGARAAGRSPLSTLAEFVGSQGGVLGGTLFVAVLAVLWRSARAARAGDDRARFVAATSLPILLVYLALSLRTQVQANWAFPGYLVALAAVGGAVASWGPARLALLLGPPALASALGLTGLPPPLARALAPRLDPGNRLIGWAELGKEVGRLTARLDPHGRLVLAGRRYQETAELAFYVPGQPRVHCLPVRPGGNQYDYWPGAHPPEGADVLLVRPDGGPLEADLRAHADSAEALAPIVIRRYGREIRRHAVYLLRGYRAEARTR